jgi:chaperonin GroEL (HSP60 family)
MLLLLLLLLSVAGGGLRDSFLVDGVAFKKTFSYAGFEQQPKSFNSKCCCSTAASMCYSHLSIPALTRQLLMCCGYFEQIASRSSPSVSCAPYQHPTTLTVSPNPDHVVLLVADPKILLLNIELELKSEKENAEIRLDDPAKYQSIVDAGGDQQLINFMLPCAVLGPVRYLNITTIVVQVGINTLATTCYHVLYMGLCYNMCLNSTNVCRPACSLWGCPGCSM